MELTYSLCGDYLIPNLALKDTTEKLLPHLAEIDAACREQMETMEKAMMKQEGVTEALKAADQMEWVRRMNSIHSRAEETVLHDLIYDG